MKAQTLWSETLLEMLFHALRKERSDREVREILRELRAKGYRSGYLVTQTDERVNAAAAWRVRRLVV